MDAPRRERKKALASNDSVRDFNPKLPLIVIARAGATRRSLAQRFRASTGAAVGTRKLLDRVSLRIFQKDAQRVHRHSRMASLLHADTT